MMRRKREPLREDEGKYRGGHLNGIAPVDE
jgi:hypothetical protein